MVIDHEVILSTVHPPFYLYTSSLYIVTMINTLIRKAKYIFRAITFVKIKYVLHNIMEEHSHVLKLKITPLFVLFMFLKSYRFYVIKKIKNTH